MSAMREPTFLILTALAAQARHGYGIITDVSELSGGRVKLAPGTLYAALDRLAEEGLVEIDREETVSGRMRRYYRLSTTGASALATAAEQLRAHAAAASARLAIRRAGLATVIPATVIPAVFGATP
ncbi:MAG TPA: PadR family transcriptional regulator [Micromonosporaceae bacterium]|nr:PadR family transcriptional regulator [Micromonosporaceae bacterium]